MGVVMPEQRSAPVKVVVFQCPCGTAARQRFGAAIDARHLRRSAGLIDEDETGWIELRPGVQPGLAPRGDVGPVLLGCVRRFF